MALGIGTQFQQASLRDIPAEDMDQLREDAASVLLRAAEDGTLEAVLSSRVKGQKARAMVQMWIHIGEG